MSEKIEFTGTDVSQAIANACDKLQVSQGQLNIEVLAAGSTGIFGIIGKKKAKIVVSLKKKKGKGSTSQRPQRGAKNGRPNKANHRRSSARKERPPEKKPAALSPENLTEVKEDLEKILGLMGMPAEVEVTNKANKIYAHIATDNTEEIVGSEGQTLDSLQYLMRKIISRRIEGKVMFSLDAGNYRDQRRQELEKRALNLADEVKESGRTKSIPALNPAERRIVHMTLQDDSTIRSRSVGDGHFKKILIYLPGRGKKKRNNS